jgi:hypothetical protein
MAVTVTSFPGFESYDILTRVRAGRPAEKRFACHVRCAMSREESCHDPALPCGSSRKIFKLSPSLAATMNFFVARPPIPTAPLLPPHDGTFPPQDPRK